MAWNYPTAFSPTVPTSAGISHVVADVEAFGGEKWEHLKSGGKQWQATPKNLPRMQRTRAIPVSWLNSGLCPDRPKGWIPIIIITIIIIIIIFASVNKCFNFWWHAYQSWSFGAVCFTSKNNYFDICDTKQLTYLASKLNLFWKSMSGSKIWHSIVTKYFV